MYTRKAIRQTHRKNARARSWPGRQQTGKATGLLAGLFQAGVISVIRVAVVGLGAAGVGAIALYAHARYQQQFLTPSVALVLGGAPEREHFAAQFAKAHPTVEIWVSSGSNPEYAKWVFDQAEVPAEQWHLDYKAVDTVTNFTTLVDDLEAKGVDEVYLLTSDYHMRRACVVAQIVLGSRGIAFKPVEIPTSRLPYRPESAVRDIRDGARSLLWLATGKTGSQWRGPADQPNSEQTGSEQTGE